MFILWVIRIILLVTVITVIRNIVKVLTSQELKATIYRKVRNIPVAGKIIVLCWRFVKKVALCLFGIVKRVALALWDTVVWLSKLPVIKQVVAIPVMLFKKLAGLWQKLLAWSAVD